MGEFHGNQHTENPWDGFEYDDLVTGVAELAEELGRPPRTGDAERDDRFPCLSRIYDVVEDDWAQVLRDAGVGADPTQVGSYDETDHRAMLDDMRRVCEASRSDYLTSREYLEEGEYASSTIKERFGSWAAACSAAGIRPGTKHGERCRGPNGNTLDSRQEQAVAYILDEQGIDYEAHPPVPGTNWTSDFRLASDLWVEVDGYATNQRPNVHSFARKLAYFEAEGFDYVVLDSPRDVEEKVFDRMES